jgi:hypothetical protein
VLGDATLASDPAGRLSVDERGRDVFEGLRGGLGTGDGGIYIEEGAGGRVGLCLRELWRRGFGRRNRVLWFPASTVGRRRS